MQSCADEHWGRHRVVHLSPEAFKQIYFVDSNIGKPRLVGRDLIVPIEEVRPADRSLWNRGDTFAGVMIFRNAARSVRVVYEYVGDPKISGETKPARQEIDIDRDVSVGATQEYLFEGISQGPTAWLSWTVQAESVELEAEERRERR